MNKNPVNREETSGAERKAAYTAAFLILLCIVYLFAGILFGFYITCPFRTITGLRCPGCGLSHAATHLAGLDIKDAFLANAMFVPIFVYLAYALIRTFPHDKENSVIFSEITGRRVDAVFLIVILLWWLIRNLFSL